MQSFLKNVTALWIAFGVLVLSTLFTWIFVPEQPWVWIGLGVLTLGVLGLITAYYWKALTGRTGAHAVRSIVTVLLVLGFLTLLNFLAVRYPYKLDLTKNKIHTLSDQTIKIVKALDAPLKVRFFSSLAEKEKNKELLERYKGLSPNFQLIYVNPEKEIMAVRQEGITESETLLLEYGDRREKVVRPDEQKLTNTIIKITRTTKQTLCAITGHGERDLKSTDKMGFSNVKAAMEAPQVTTVKEVNLPQEPTIPKDCSAIAILGPQKPFFEKEVTALSEFLQNGGRAFFALDPAPDGKEKNPELVQLLSGWGVKVRSELILDEVTGRLIGDLSAIITQDYSREHVITKEFSLQTYFPGARPLEMTQPVPVGLNAQWIVRTLPTSWGESDFEGLRKGRIQKNPGQDVFGPLIVGLTVEGKKADSKATKNTRIVVFGNSLFAVNAQARYGGNMDLFLNATSWLLEEEGMISIRPKDDAGSKLMISRQAFLAIMLITIVIAPLLIAVSGIVIWVRRRKL